MKEKNLGSDWLKAMQFLIKQKKKVQKREDIVQKQENTMEIQSNPVNMLGP